MRQKKWISHVRRRFSFNRKNEIAPGKVATMNVSSFQQHKRKSKNITLPGWSASACFHVIKHSSAWPQLLILLQQLRIHLQSTYLYIAIVNKTLQCLLSTCKNSFSHFLTIVIWQDHVVNKDENCKVHISSHLYICIVAAVKTAVKISFSLQNP